MGAPYSLILRKLEKAVVTYLGTFDITAAGQPVEVVCGKASVNKPVPLVVVYAERGIVRPDEEFSGNRDITLHVMVKYSLPVDADGVDPVPESDALTAAVFDAMLPGGPGDDHTLADALNTQGVADFTATNNQYVGEEAGAEDDVWVETLTLLIHCAPTSGL